MDFHHYYFHYRENVSKFRENLKISLVEVSHMRVFFQKKILLVSYNFTILDSMQV